ncbi:peptidoglycan editing factor PgeF [Parasulfitobacter algicola]|uniref:Purine nucleoside phosphorylase n=1 Tax=Parasulfitobacter algicola TaxID=2614809 RepID=A0ABX2IT83_9RHOB|nr:peptidoglycan editing factor PgeF [Sulfitobacter algicola]NSX56127.1 peptidoglycan editing factor PgeF [Sulfitobacter algicola]
MTLEILTSDDFSNIRHGFFTRRGGASSGVFSGLNCGSGSSDQADIVSINRARVADAMNVDAENLLTVNQVHSADVVVVNSAFKTRPKADAIVTNQPGIALGILTADCQPVLFADEKNAVIGAAHAGWQGALAGVLEATLDAMETQGAERQEICAVIGPSISQRTYEVGPEFLDRFIAEDSDFSRFFANGDGDKYHFDLPGFGLHRLRIAGVGFASWTGHCTYSDPDRFFSYRRSVHNKEVDYGRLISAIRL